MTAVDRPRVTASSAMPAPVTPPPMPWPRALVAPQTGTSVLSVRYRRHVANRRATAVHECAGTEVPDEEVDDDRPGAGRAARGVHVLPAGREDGRHRAAPAHIAVDGLAAAEAGPGDGPGRDHPPPVQHPGAEPGAADLGQLRHRHLRRAR